MELNETIHNEHEHASVSLKVMLLIFGVILVGTLGYLVYSQNTEADDTDNTAPKVTTTETTETKTEETATTADETADWKTYTGTYFSFKYPADWKLSTTGLGDSNLLAQLISPATQKKLDAGEMCYEVCQEQIRFYYYDKVADERENKANGSKYTTLDELTTKTETFKRIGAVTINGASGYDGIRAGLSAYYQIYLSKNNHLYEIFFNHREAKASVSATENLIVNNYKVLN